MPSASVIVCTHTADRLDQLRRAVRSVLDGTRVPDELFVVVDRNPELRDRLGAELPPAVTVLDSEAPGASAARNTALHHATAEVIACLDDDAWADPDWLAELVAVFDDPTVAGAGGRIVPDWEDPDVALPAELHWIVGCTYAGHRPDAGPITRPIGASMAGRRDAMLAIGGFSPEFGPGAGPAGSFNEELVLFTELRRRHGPGCVRYVPTAVVHHHAPVARTTWAYLRSRSAVEGRSKADARARLGRDVMAHDQRYVTRTLLPAIGRGLVRSDGRSTREVAMMASSLLITATAYAGRRLAGSRRR